MTHFHAHGKLLLTAEYFVLDGATALALPVRLGQKLEIGNRRFTPVNWEIGKLGFHWRSLDEQGACWFEAKFDPKNFAGLLEALNMEALENQIVERQVSKWISTGFGGWHSKGSYLLGTLVARKEQLTN